MFVETTEYKAQEAGTFFQSWLLVKGRVQGRGNSYRNRRHDSLTSRLEHPIGVKEAPCPGNGGAHVNGWSGKCWGATPAGGSPPCWVGEQWDWRHWEVGREGEVKGEREEERAIDSWNFRCGIKGAPKFPEDPNWTSNQPSSRGTLVTREMQVEDLRGLAPPWCPQTSLLFPWVHQNPKRLPCSPPS